MKLWGSKCFLCQRPEVYVCSGLDSGFPAWGQNAVERALSGFDQVYGPFPGTRTGSLGVFLLRELPVGM